MAKTKMKLWVKLTIIFSSIIVGLGAVLGIAILCFRLPVNAYYKASEKAFVIPEINDGYVPQGFHYVEEDEQFVMSGYMSDGSASPVYLLNKKGKLLKKVFLSLENGKTYKGHGGGVAVGGNFLYITGGTDNCVYVYSYSELKSDQVTNGEKLSYVGKINLDSENDNIQTAFVTVVGNRLITGEFYRAKKYPTPQSHKVKTSSGEYNRALAVEYLLDSSSPTGVSAQPIKAYSLPNQVQGLTINDGKIYLSTSWGLSFSHILEYDESQLTTQQNISVVGYTLPLYVLDSQSLIKDYKIAPMSEELAFVDGKLYVHSESASNKYIFGKFTGGKWLYKTDLNKM